MRVIIIVFSTCFLVLNSSMAQDFIGQDSLVDDILSEREIILRHIDNETPYHGEFPVQVSNIVLDQEINIVLDQLNDNRFVMVFDVVREVMNQSGDFILDKGDSCNLLHVGNKLKVLGFSPDSKQALVENIGDSLTCPEGAMFFIPVEELVAFEDEYETVLQKNKAVDELVDAILINRGVMKDIQRFIGWNEQEEFPVQVSNIVIDQEIRAPSLRIVDVVREVMNQSGDGSFYIDKSSRCILNVGNKLKVLGFSPDSKQALVENIGYSLHCLEGAMFFIPVEELVAFEDETMDKLVDAILINRGVMKDTKRFTGWSEQKEFPVQVSNIVIDQEIRTPSLRIVEVVRRVINLGSSNWDFILDKGEKCILNVGNKLKVLGFAPDSKQALVENIGDSLDCLEGAMFFIPVEELATFEDE